MTTLAIVVSTMGVLLAQAPARVQITVLSAGAVEPGLRAAAAAFEKSTGHTITIAFTPVPQIRTRITGGETWDVVIATPAVLDEFVTAGKIENQRAALGRVGMGVAVRAGAPVPDISNVDAFKKSMLGAEALLFTRGSSGIYFEGLLKKLAVYDQVAARISRHDDGESAIAALLKGTGAVMAGQLTEIRLHVNGGVRLVGPLPGEVQNYTSYAAAPMTARPNAAVAREFVRHLAGTESRALFTAAGIGRE
jgi:molybdate transport system substrate-binding protein